MAMNNLYVNTIHVKSNPELYKLAIEDLAKKMDIVLYVNPISNLTGLAHYIKISFLTTEEKKKLFYKELKDQYDLR